MDLNTEDEAKTIPIAVFDANKGKEAANNNFLICTFSSLDAISIINKMQGRFLDKSDSAPGSPFNTPLPWTNF